MILSGPGRPYCYTISKMMSRNILKSLTVILCSLSLFSCSQQASKMSKESQNESQFVSQDTLEIKTIEGEHYIAIAAPLTGPYRDLGNTIVEGATLAVEEFNDKMGKQKVGTIIIDDGGLVSEGLARADLILAQKALGVIGHLNSEISIETSKKYSAAEIAQISPASTNPKFTERPDVKGFVFRTIGTDRQLGQVAAQYVVKNEEFKKIAVLYNDRPYGVSVSSEFVREIAKDPKRDHDLVLYKTIPVRTEDHKKTAKEVAKAKPDLVFFVGEYNDAGYLLKDIKTLLPNVQFLGGEGVHHQKFIEIAGKLSEGALVLGSKPVNDDIKEKFNRKYGKDSAGYAGSSYKATEILLEAAKDKGFKSSKKIAKEIAANKLFDPNGDLIEPDFVIYKVENGKFAI